MDGSPYPADVVDRLAADAVTVIARCPSPRSALLPLLHLVQAEDGYLTKAGIAFCANQLGLTDAEVAAVAIVLLDVPAHRDRPVPHRRAPTHCAPSWAATPSRGTGERPRRARRADHRRRTDHPEHIIECNAACDYAPVVMVNWEFFDNQTPSSARNSSTPSELARHPGRPGRAGVPFKETADPRRGRTADRRHQRAPVRRRWPDCGWPRRWAKGADA